MSTTLSALWPQVGIEGLVQSVVLIPPPLWIRHFLCRFLPLYSRLHHHVIYVLIYMDGFISIGLSLDILRLFIDSICSTFNCRDLGLLSFFLGLKMVKMSNFTVICQRIYSMSLLNSKELSLFDTKGALQKRLSLILCYLRVSKVFEVVVDICIID